ncbi:MAG: PAS domain S-box protein [Limnospira sp.]
MMPEIILWFDFDKKPILVSPSPVDNCSRFAVDLTLEYCQKNPEFIFEIEATFKEQKKRDFRYKIFSPTDATDIEFSATISPLPDRRLLWVARPQEAKGHSSFASSQILSDITLKIRQSLDLSEILATTVTEVRSLLDADRVVMFQLRSANGGIVVQEAVRPQWKSLSGQEIVDPCFHRFIKAYRDGRTLSISNVGDSHLVRSCYRELLDYFQVQAVLIVPIVSQGHLWGLLIVHQCRSPRHWRPHEIDLLKQLADQVGIALDQAQLLRQLRQAHQQISFHVENSPLAVVEWNSELRILRWSDRAEQLFGWSAAETIGRQWSELNWVVEADRDRVLQACIRLIDGTEDRQICSNRNATKNGQILHCEWYNSACRDEAGNLISILSLGQDITERTRVQEALRQSEERWQLALRGNNDGIWDWNVETDAVFFSARWKEMLGYAEHEIINQLEEWEKRVHPEDRDWVMQAIADHFNKKTPFYITEHRIRCKDGSYKWILDRGQAVWDEFGRVTRMVGSHTDISPRKQAEAALRQSEARYSSLTNDVLDKSEVGIFILDADFRVVWINRAIERFFGIQRTEAIGKDKRQLIRDRIQSIFADPDRFAATVLATYDNNTYIEQFECHILPDGDRAERWLEHLSQPIASGLYAGGRIEHYTDISRHKQTETELQRLNWALKTISHCNRATVRATTETQLLNQICEILVTVGGYRRVSVEYAQFPDIRHLTPVAGAGGTLDSEIGPNLDERKIALRLRRPRVFSEQRESGISAIAVPLIRGVQGRNTADSASSPTPVFGVLTLYRDRPDTFDTAEVQFLSELADDLAFGINAGRTHRQASESEEKFRQLAENIHDVFWMSDRSPVAERQSWNILYVSPAYEDVWGRSCRSLYRSPDTYFEAIHPDDRGRAIAAFQNHPATHLDIEYRIVRPDGSIRWIWDRAFPIFDDRGQMYRRAGIAKDITQRKEAEELLWRAKAELEVRVRSRTAELAEINRRLQQELEEHRRTEAQLLEGRKLYRTLVQNFPKGAVFLFDPDLRHSIADGVALATHGLSSEQIEGKTIWEVFSPATCEAIEPHYRRALIGETSTGELEQEGRIYYVQTLPVRNEEGNKGMEPLVAGMMVMQDITERKQAENLRDRLIAIIEATPDFIASATPTGEIVYFNRSAREVLGLPPEGAIEWDISKHHPQWATEILWEEGIPTALREGTWLGETALLSAAGREIPISQRIIAHRSDEGPISLLSTIARDITDQKQTEANLREAERRWRSLLENVHLLVVSLDCDGRIEYVNPFFLELTGYSAAEIKGQTWSPPFIPPHQEKVQAQFRDLLNHTLNSHGYHSILTKAGEEKMIAWNHTLLQSPDGQAIGTMSIGEDITERYAIERMKDEFISVVSHELRTPLTSIYGGLNLICSHLDPSSDRGRQVIEIATESAGRLVRLVNDILELERLESGKISLCLQMVNAGYLLVRAGEQMQVMANRAGIAIDVVPQDLKICADPDRILQVLTNLLGNAIKFSDSGSRVTLTVAQAGGDSRCSPAVTSPCPSPVLFSVSDTGRGIPPHKIESIFERFHQVDASDSRQKGGTGLGLAICRSIVEQHGGRIWVKSTPNVGSCFYFTLSAQIEEDKIDES